MILPARLQRANHDVGNYIRLERPSPRDSIFRSFYAPVNRISNHTRKFLAALALFLQCVAAPRAWAHAETAAAEVTTATTRAWVLTDLGSGEYLPGEDATERLPMGSTPGRTASRPRSGRCSTASPPTTARISSPGVKSTPKLT